MVAQDVTSSLDMNEIAQKALSDGDPKILLALLLSGFVYVLREHLLAKTPEEWGRIGAAMRWLGSTHFGGVASSILAAGFGAVVTAIQSGAHLKPAAILNVFVIAAMASGVSTWSKLGKRREQPKQPEKSSDDAVSAQTEEQVTAKPEATVKALPVENTEPEDSDFAPVEVEQAAPSIEVVTRPSKKKRKPEPNGEIKLNGTDTAEKKKSKKKKPTASTILALASAGSVLMSSCAR